MRGEGDPDFLGHTLPPPGEAGPERGGLEGAPGGRCQPASGCTPCPLKGQEPDHREEVLNVRLPPCRSRTGEELREAANEQIVWAAVFRPPEAGLTCAVPGRS